MGAHLGTSPGTIFGLANGRHPLGNLGDACESTCSRDTHVIVKQRTASADRQNVTLSLPRTLLKRVKVLAAEEDKSMSQLMEEALEERVRRRAAYEQARRRHLRVLERGFDLGTGGRLQVSRDELHERQ